jgi:serine/threonine protein kinase
MARLQREFDCTRKLSHPNVVKVYEFDRNEEFGFYTMELLEGEHLGDLLERVDRHPLPHPYAWAIIGAVGAALAHAHSRNVIHGDVSPKNVMITRGGEVRVLDFGSSTTANGGGPPGESEARRTVAATPAYASCEVLEGQRADPRDDLYALACLAYELLTGEHPFQGKRSIEARDLGMRPRRPPGLRFSRWRAIQRGLSWTREGRSIPVRQWLGQLGIEPEPERLPPFRETTKSGPYLPSLNMSKRMALVIAAFVGIALAWSSIHRGSRGLDSTGSQTASKALRAAGESIAAVQANRSEPSTSTTPVHLRVLPSDRAIASLDVAPPVPVNGPPESPHPVPHRAAGAPRPTSARSIQFTSNRYSAVSSAHFVETHVWRSRTSGDTNSFVWWTDNSSAKAGIDFVAQAPTPYRFSAGRQLASLFVRLIPNPGRSQAKDFHVCLGKRSTGSALTDVTCSAILLPAHADRPS